MTMGLISVKEFAHRDQSRLKSLLDLRQAVPTAVQPDFLCNTDDEAIDQYCQ